MKNGRELGITPGYMTSESFNCGSLWISVNFRSLPRGAALESALFWLSVIINVIFLACALGILGRNWGDADAVSVAKFRSSIELGVLECGHGCRWSERKCVGNSAEKCCFTKSWISPEVGMRAGTIIGCHRCDVLLFIPTSTVLNIFVSAPSSALLVTLEVLFLFFPSGNQTWQRKKKWVIFPWNPPLSSGIFQPCLMTQEGKSHKIL